MSMDREIQQEYMELLEEMLSAAVEAARRLQTKIPSRQRLQQAFKRPDWAPRDKADWDRHIEVTNDDGERVGFLDTEDDLVDVVEAQEDEDALNNEDIEVEPHNDIEAANLSEASTEDAPQRESSERLASVGGGAWVATEAQGRGRLERGRLVDEEGAHEWLNANGWDVVSEKGVKESSQLDPDEGGRPTVVDGVDVEAPPEAGEIIARNARVNTEKPEKVRVSGAGTVNGTASSDWDDVAREADGRVGVAVRREPLTARGEEDFAVETSAQREHTQMSPSMD